MFILDVLQHDVAEQVSSIVRLLNNRGCIGWREFWPHDFSAEEVCKALETMVDDDLVTVYCEDTAKSELIEFRNRPLNAWSDSLWFGRSNKGKKAWDEWEPPVNNWT